MGKVEELIDKKEQILGVAEKGGINDILFYKPIHTESQEEDPFIYCLVDVLEKPDQPGETRRYNLLNNFKQEVEKFLPFKLLLSPLDTQKAHLERMPDDLELKQEYQEMLDSAINIKDLVGNLSLLEQINKKADSLKKNNPSQEEEIDNESTPFHIPMWTAAEEKKPQKNVRKEPASSIEPSSSDVKRPKLLALSTPSHNSPLLFAGRNEAGSRIAETRSMGSLSAENSSIISKPLTSRKQELLNTLLKEFEGEEEQLFIAVQRAIDKKRSPLQQQQPHDSFFGLSGNSSTPVTGY